MITISAPFVGVQPASAVAQASLALDNFLPTGTATVGETGTATVRIENTSTPPDGPLTLGNVTVTICADAAVPTCTPDPNPVLVISPVAGSGTGACAGATFTATTTGGRTIITPATPVVLAAPDATPGAGPDFCSFQFTYIVQRVPVNDISPVVPGNQTLLQVSVAGTSVNTGAPSFNSISSVVGVLEATPSIVTQTAQVQPPAPPPAPGTDPTVTIGSTFSDTATVTGVANGPTPSGQVTFRVFLDPPGAAPTCAPATEVLPAQAPVTVTGPAPTPPTPPTASATSQPVTATALGTYRFVVTYTGDPNYTDLGPTPCGAPGENVLVAPRTATLTTQASNNGQQLPPGTQVTDLAFVTPDQPGPAPTGTVTYTLVGPLAPGDATCTASPTVPPTPPAAPQTVPVGQPSPTYAPTLPGTYNFVATYSGDVNYSPVNTPVGCGDPAERFTIVLRTAQLRTQASTNDPFVAPGTAVTDQAFVTPTTAGAPTPTGTVTYALIGPLAPGDATCTASPVVPPTPAGAPQTVPVGQPSPTYTPTATGTYNFVATYSGDANYAPINTPVGCGDAAERFTIAIRTVTLTTQASTNSPNVPPGSTVFDTAAVTPTVPGPAPTGTVTYTLVGPLAPGDATCTASPIVPPTPAGASQTVPVGQRSPDYVVTAPGTYNFLATYDDPSNVYQDITTPVGCGVPGEQFTVTLRQVVLVTAASTNSTTVPPGTAVTDIATVTPATAGGPAPTGTVTYSLVGPLAAGDTTCTASPVVPPTPAGASQTVPVGQPSPTYTPTAVGTYNFLATYSGDANYAAITAPVGCNDPAERFTVATRPIGLTTTASTNSANVPPGTAVTDLAVFTPPAGGPAPTGTVTYTLVGPLAAGDTTCTASPVVPPTPAGASQTVPVGQSSPTYVVTELGTYNFLATYSGDTNYAPITTPVGCGDPNERFTVARQPINLTTQASTNAQNLPPGTVVTDLATLTPTTPGAPAPTGTVTYTLVGPLPANDTTCTAPAVPPTPANASQTVPVGQPSPGYAPTAVGTYNFLATYSGDAFYLPLTTPVGCGVPGERFSVILAPIALTTVASPPVPVGGQIFDTARLSGGINPTGTISFALFGPDNPTCSGNPIFTDAVTVNGNGDYPSGPYTVTAAGSYRWIATYSGDANNAPAGPTACADPLEVTAGLRVTPTLVTVASAGTLGGQVFDTATLSGGFNPTGSITFQLFGPNDEDCSGPPIFVSVKPVTGNGNVISDSFILPAPGIYHFVATYSGDANNNAVGPTACLDPNETIGIGRLPISLSTQASPSVPTGGTISDTATLAGGFNPTGTITFRLYGPNNDTCTGDPIFVSVVTVNGNGSYPSTSFTPTAPGTYRWIAEYSGDANNASAITACDDPLESVVVTPLPVIEIVKTAAPPSLPVPGGTFIFDLVVTNTSTVPLTIRTLTDNIYGDVTQIPGSTCNTAINTVLAPSPGPGNTYSCRFPGDFRGPAGASQTDIVTVTATDDRGNTVRDNDDAVVTITPVAPSITTVKTANPPSLPEPGGTFTFTYTVTNTGPEPVTVTSIIDDVYGDLNGRGTCAVGARLAANGGSYSCTFTGNFFGNAGATQTDTITTTAVDDRGQTVTSQARATVTITNVPPAIQIVKTPDPLSRPEPGGTFRFTVTVTNPSFEAVTITSLVDDIYGDLNGRGSCAIGVVLAANGGSYSCAFDGEFRGRAGDTQTDTVTVTGVDDEGTVVTALARATVVLTPVSVPPVVPPPPPPPPPPAPRVLVRTGTDVEGPVRLAGVMLLMGLTLIGATWWFGDGGPGLAGVPAGPGGGGPRGGGGGFWYGGHRFGGARVEPPRGPFGGSGGVGLLEPPVRAPETDDDDDDLAWDDWVGERTPRRPTPMIDAAPVVEAEPEWDAVEVEPRWVVEAEPEAVVPDAVLPAAGRPETGRPDTGATPVRATGALDGAALDAASAGPVTPAPAPPAGGRRFRRGGR